MTLTISWLAALESVAVLFPHEVLLAVAQRRCPERMGRMVYATLREDWFEAASALSHFTTCLTTEPVLLAPLFAFLVSSVAAVRHYNHASFVGGVCVESDASKRKPPQARPTSERPACAEQLGASSTGPDRSWQGVHLLPRCWPDSCFHRLQGFFSLDRFQRKF